MEESYKTVPYINNNIADIISAATIIISRSGAGSLWEFITVGTPSILIPLTSGSRGDQIKNANYFRDRGASLVLTGEKVNKNSLIECLNNIYEDKDQLNQLKNSAQTLGNENCAQKICKLIGESI